ncbi:SET domain-containing protein SmydA-8 isoform X2 [Augochlora pura]
MSSMALVERSKSSGTSIPSKYNVAHSEKLGRYLQSAKDLTASEVIIREKPIAVGPIISSKDYVCFGCLRFIPKTIKISQHVCSKCNVALLCGPNCKADPKYHTQDECEMFKNNKDLSLDNIEEIIGILLPLRVWLLKQREPTTWRQVECMEAHIDKRRNTSAWIEKETNVINVIRALNLIPDHDESTSELLQQVCSILDVNAFELRSPGGTDGCFVRGLYMEASLMAHDCRGNTYLTVSDNFQLTVFASLPIQQGATIFFNYTSCLLGTVDRREHLRFGKYFECECSLCKDPYEMGSYMSSILCPRCRQGYLGIQNPLTINPYKKIMRWQCDRCRRSIGGPLVRATLNISKTLIEDIHESDIKGMETLASKLKRSLHPNHFLMLVLKQKLVAAYMAEMPSFPTKRNMEKLLDTCKEICEVLEIVEPGISRLKAMMLYNLHWPLVMLPNLAYVAREISLAELSSRLEEAKSVLKRSLRMLLLEPAETPEGKLAKIAMQGLKVLNQNIGGVTTLISTIEEQGFPTIGKTTTADC